MNITADRRVIWARGAGERFAAQNPKAPEAEARAECARYFEKDLQREWWNGYIEARRRGW